MREMRADRRGRAAAAALGDSDVQLPWEWPLVADAGRRSPVGGRWSAEPGAVKQEESRRVASGEQ